MVEALLVVSVHLLISNALVLSIRPEARGLLPLLIVASLWAAEIMQIVDLVNERRIPRGQRSEKVGVDVDTRQLKFSVLRRV